MYIQRKICHRAQCINHKRSNCNIWNKTAIHYINVNPITTSQLHCFHLDKITHKLQQSWSLIIKKHANSALKTKGQIYWQSANMIKWLWNITYCISKPKHMKLKYWLQNVKHVIEPALPILKSLQKEWTERQWYRFLKTCRLEM